jgi:hypothetical protein
MRRIVGTSCVLLAIDVPHAWIGCATHCLLVAVRLIFRPCYSATVPSDHTIVNFSRYRASGRRRIEGYPSHLRSRWCVLPKRRNPRTRAEAPSRPPERPAVIHSSLYLPAPVYEVLRQIAFDERAKIHDLVMQGIEAVCGSEDIRPLTISSLARNGKSSWNRAEFLNDFSRACTGACVQGEGGVGIQMTLQDDRLPTTLLTDLDISHLDLVLVTDDESVEAIWSALNRVLGHNDNLLQCIDQ